MIDFTAGIGNDLLDVAAQLSWPVGSGDVLDSWEPHWTSLLPDSINDRPTEWNNGGFPGNKLIRGFVLELDTFNAPKTFNVERSDDNTLRTPDQIPVTVNGQTLTPFTFVTPFTAHDLRLISTDGVAWRRAPDAEWGMNWIFDQWPEYAPLRSAWSNLGVQGAKYLRGLVVPMDTNGAVANFTVVTSDGGSVSFSATTPAAKKTVVSFAFVPPIVAHDVQLQMNSNAAVWTEEIRWDFDPYPEIIPEYTPIMEVNGSGAKLVRGLNITGDTANVSTSFVISYDGGQTGPTVTAAFNGKQTKAFAFTPFIAHDIQLIPQANARICIDESKWDMDPWPEYTAFYSAWMNLGTNGAKYIRSLTMPMDTNGSSSVVNIVTSDGATIPLASTTTPSGVKTQVSFAFTPPFIAHELRFVLKSPVGLWAEEAKFDFDPYPEIIPEYTAILEIGGSGAKYFRGLTLTADTANVSTSFQILYDGGQNGPVVTAAFNGKQTKAFAFTPFVFHDIQIVPQANARIWIAESQWHFDVYPELTAEYTPIMEVSGTDNKFVQGVKLIADTANIPVTFQVLYDGGQTGPTFTGTFNGKQTLVFSWPPFLAHDIQLVPQANARIWYGGVGQGESAWQYQPFPEMATNWTTETTALGGKGWQFLRYMDIPYLSNSAITITFTVDTGNGSIAPQPIILPSSGGTQTKSFTQLTPNKWKLIGFSAISSAPFALWLPELEVIVRSWGVDNGGFRVEKPFGGPSSPGASV